MRPSSPRVLVSLFVATCLGAAAALHRCSARPQVTTLAPPTMGARYAVTRHALASVTVVRPTAAEADALAAAMMVLGPEGALALADREHLAAYFILRTADGSFEPRQTREFAALRAD